MKKFTIAITEHLSTWVDVEAENVAEARQKVRKQWEDGEIVLLADDFTGEAEFEYVTETEITEK